MHPSVSVLPRVPEQWAAWPMYVSVPFVKMKFEVHWAPSVNVCTPGWIVALLAGAQVRVVLPPPPPLVGLPERVFCERVFLTCDLPADTCSRSAEVPDAIAAPGTRASAAIAAVAMRSRLMIMI